MTDPRHVAAVAAAACSLLAAACLVNVERSGCSSLGLCSFMHCAFEVAAGLLMPQHSPGITGTLVGVSPEVAHSVRERHRLPTHKADDEQTLYDVVVVGGGAAGLAAAWRMAETGPPSLRCLVLELEEQTGGNSRGGSDPATGLSFPWGAHYLPVPSPTGPTAEVARLVSAVLGRSSPPDECDEQPWCRSQLFMPDTRRWEEPPERGGMVPTAAMDAEGWRQYHRFMAIVDRYVAAVGTDGRRAFAVPVDASSTDPSFRALDDITMSEWMDTNGFTSPPLRWFVDYGCRDDYGTTLDTTSAWVAFHYFCSRETENSLVWEDGLGSIVSGMTEHLQAGNVRRCANAGDDTSRERCQTVTIRTSRLVHRIETHSRLDGQATVEYSDLRSNVSRTVQARRVIFAAPHHSARHIVAGYSQKEREDAIDCGAEGCLNFTYAPWVVANVFLREPPPRPWAWENMVYRPRVQNMHDQHYDEFTLKELESMKDDLGALGYVIAPSQIRRWSTWQSQPWPIRFLAPLSWLISPLQAQKLWSAVTRTPFSTTLTAFFMQPVSASAAAFPNAWLRKDWEEWREEVLNSLRLSIPTIDEIAYRIDVRVLAHAMNRPVPGFLWGRRSPRLAARRPFAGVVWFAHSDNSGLSLFEEAVSQGFRAADEVLASLSE